MEQIIHLYGAETLRAALLSSPDPDDRVAELERMVAEQTALRREAETRADQAERRERALLDTNQRERSAVVELASLRSRMRDALRRAEAEPDRALDLLLGVVTEAGGA